MNPKRMQSITDSVRIKTDDGHVLYLDEMDKAEGGYGVVYKGHYEDPSMPDEDPSAPVAVKFMQDAETDGESERLAKEILRKWEERFDNEISRLNEMNHKVLSAGLPPFPDYYGRGSWEGRPFYVMEWLSPVNLLELDTDDQRYKYAYDVCYAVQLEYPQFSDGWIEWAPVSLG